MGSLEAELCASFVTPADLKRKQPPTQMKRRLLVFKYRSRDLSKTQATASSLTSSARRLRATCRRRLIVPQRSSERIAHLVQAFTANIERDQCVSIHIAKTIQTRVHLILSFKLDHSCQWAIVASQRGLKKLPAQRKSEGLVEQLD